MVALKNKSHYYRITFLVYLERFLKVINYVLEVEKCGPPKSLKSP